MCTRPWSASGPPEPTTGPSPGPWKGDLLISKNASSALGAPVERTTGYLLLLHHPRTADGPTRWARPSVARPPSATGNPFRTITRDQGKEMARHAAVTVNTGIHVSLLPVSAVRYATDSRFGRSAHWVDPAGDGRQRGQITCPPLGSFDGHERAGSVTATGQNLMAADTGSPLRELPAALSPPGPLCSVVAASPGPISAEAAPPTWPCSTAYRTVRPRTKLAKAALPRRPRCLLLDTRSNSLVSGAGHLGEA